MVPILGAEEIKKLVNLFKTQEILKRASIEHGTQSRKSFKPHHETQTHKIHVKCH